MYNIGDIVIVGNGGFTGIIKGYNEENKCYIIDRGFKISHIRANSKTIKGISEKENKKPIEILIEQSKKRKKRHEKRNQYLKTKKNNYEVKVFVKTLEPNNKVKSIFYDL